MKRESCIRHSAKEKLAILRNDYLQICKDRIEPAMLLGIIEYWTNINIAKNEQILTENKARIKEGIQPKPISFWIYRTHEQFVGDTLKILKDYQVRKGLKYLLEKKLIQRRRNPDLKWDRTYQYLLNIQTIQNLIDEYNVCKRDIYKLEDDNITNQSRPYNGAIQECSNEVIKEEKKEKEHQSQQQEKNINFSFIEFWNKYDKKVGSKKKLEKKWFSFSDKTRNRIMKHLNSYILATPDKYYRKNPQTYFNNEAWNDEIVKQKPVQNKDEFTDEDFYAPMGF